GAAGPAGGGNGIACVEDRGRKNGTPAVGFEVLAVLAETLARALEFHDRAERATARCGLRKLLGDVGERGGFRQIAAGLPDRGSDHLGISEPLKERDEVGKRFVKGDRKSVV